MPLPVRPICIWSAGWAAEVIAAGSLVPLMLLPGPFDGDALVLRSAGVLVAVVALLGSLAWPLWHAYRPRVRFVVLLALTGLWGHFSIDGLASGRIEPGPGWVAIILTFAAAAAAASSLVE